MLLALLEDYFELSCVTIEKFLTFWFMQQRTLSYVISVLVVFSSRREAFGFAHALFNVSLDIYGI